MHFGVLPWYQCGAGWPKVTGKPWVWALRWSIWHLHLQLSTVQVVFEGLFRGSTVPTLPVICIHSYGGFDAFVYFTDPIQGNLWANFGTRKIWLTSTQAHKYGLLGEKPTETKEEFIAKWSRKPSSMGHICLRIELLGEKAHKKEATSPTRDNLQSGLRKLYFNGPHY